MTNEYEDHLEALARSAGATPGSVRIEGQKLFNGSLTSYPLIVYSGHKSIAMRFEAGPQTYWVAVPEVWIKIER